jgi:DHA3 family multidrug efflux protein-like MFS transporter
MTSVEAIEPGASGSPEGTARGPDGGSTAGERTFRRLLVNSLVSTVTSSFLWFALTFWAYLETRSVVVTGVIGGGFSLSVALLGPAFGTYVDRHRKHPSMVLATTISMLAFAAATLVFLTVDAERLLRLQSPLFWLLVGLTLAGSVAGQMRSIAMSTCVTLLVPESRRDRANGLVGTVTGVSFAITSVFSGIVIGNLGMGWAFYVSLALIAGALVHLRLLEIPEPEPEPAADGAARIDVRGALEAITAVPGLLLIVLLSAFNNLLGGVFMALMDAYGLELVSVQAWGVLWGVVSSGFIIGGLTVAKVGLGPRPVRMLLLGNLVNWCVCATFTLHSSVIPLAVGTFVWVSLVPMIEAAEQTVLQRAVPFERQGRVFGFAQLVENAAAPITAICIGPVAQRVFMPFMTDGRGADWIGGWFGTGPERGLALIFTLAGLIGIVVTVTVRLSRSFRRLDAAMGPAAQAALAEAS